MALTQVDQGLLGTYAQYTGFKNRIINGAMVIDQRNAGASVSASGQYTLDRWVTATTLASKFTVQQNAGSVTPPVGFTNYLGVTSSSAYSVLSGDIFAIAQYIEGLNLSDLAWGTANAQTVTLSFWVRSSLTGTFGGAIQNSAQNRNYPFSYTINSANTWEQKSITIAGDTTGTWLTTNGAGLRLFISVGTGTSYSGTAGAWTGTSAYSVTGATSVVGTNGATFYITGVQLEKGSTATSFDYRPYGTELALCQRYYQRVSNGASATVLCGASLYAPTTAYGVYNLKTTMRTAPTGSTSASNVITVYAAGVGYVTSAIAATSFNGADQVEISVTVSGATNGQGAFMRLSSANSWIDFSSEL